MAKLKNIITKLNTRNTPPKGITLIEILIGVAISSLIMLALLSLYIAGQKYFFNQSAKADSIEDSRYPIEWIARDIREAVEVVEQTPDETYPTDINTLVLSVPSLDPGTGLFIDYRNVFDYIIYRQNPTYPNRFERIIQSSGGSERARVLADDVTSFVLTYFDAGGGTPASYTDTAIINIKLRSLRNGIWRPNNPYEEEINTRVKLRNKGIPEPE